MADSYHEKIAKIADLLKEPGDHWAMTGAGISTESGIADYRSPGTGLWEKTDPISTASVQAMRQNPVFFFETNLPLWASFRDTKPNAGHLALAELERRGVIRGVVTQNVDSLHLRAGSKRVFEVHGHLRTGQCLECSLSYSFYHMWRQFQDGNDIPRCSCGGMIRPDVVLFGDMMSEDFSLAQRDLSGCDLMLVLGTSLQVYPAADLPNYAQRLVIVNLMSTPYDASAQVVLREPIGQVMTDVLHALGLELPEPPAWQPV